MWLPKKAASSLLYKKLNLQVSVLISDDNLVVLGDHEKQCRRSIFFFIFYRFFQFGKGCCFVSIRFEKLAAVKNFSFMANLILMSQTDLYGLLSNKGLIFKTFFASFWFLWKFLTPLPPFGVPLSVPDFKSNTFLPTAQFPFYSKPSQTSL